MSRHFTMEERAWHAWLEPAGPDTASEAQRAAYESSVWPNSPYFRLLAWHPASLIARTELDRAIFLTRNGLPRGDRELAATVASRVNGCELCASVHARFTATFSRDAETVERLLSEGPEAELPARARAIVDAAAALTATPIAFGAHHVRALREAGLSDADITDVIQATAFFAWANRLMLSLGAPAAPDGADAAALADQRANDAAARGE
ncbi:peroxidase-related enzyme [Leucobacter chromiireducens]|uniref:peroxidase-related enzyme n=1 Tax=Leucobacter chromiireducens TaxID=283877 RepID=UPI000F62C545|nr:peroxidase-related enzyme [Leucobacter chromiireducens]